MKTDGIIFGSDWWQVARRIRSDAARARYLMAILDYAFDGTEPADEQLDVLTLTARLQIDRQRAAYEEKSEKARKSVNARYERIRTYTNEYERMQTNTNEYERMQTNTNEGNNNKNKNNNSNNTEEKDIPHGISKKKAQQAAPRAGGLSSDFKELTPDAKHPAPPEEEEKNSAQKEEEPPVVAVEVVTTRTRAQPPRFVPPTVEEVAAYCRQRQNGIDAEEFVAAYQQSGWRLKGGNQMKDWHAAVINWEKYRKRNKQQQNDRDRENDARWDAEFVRYFGPGGPGRHE